MPIHALRFVNVFGGVPRGLRCVNSEACADRERKMMARQYEMAQRWAIGGAV
jgi:hypothetical protein